MFTYFCCRWIFRIIFTSISLFYCTFKISKNDKWCFWLNWFWLNCDILISSEGIITLQKSLFSHAFLCHSSLFCFLFFVLFFGSFFVLKERSQLKQKKSPLFFMLFLLIMLVTFLLQDNVMFFCLESLKENNLFFTIWFMFWDITRIFFLL